MFWPFLGKGATGYIQQCEIWHGTTLRTLIRFRKKQFEGPCFGNKKGLFWPFLGKGATGYTQQCEIQYGAFLGTLIKIQEEST